MTRSDPPDAPNPLTAHLDAPHAPAGDQEEIYFEGSPLIRGELARCAGWMSISLILLALPFIVRYFRGTFPSWWITLSLVIASAGVSALAWLSVKTIRYRISNYRIDFERGVFSKHIDTLELWHVDDISFRQSPIDRLLGVGTILIDSNDRTTPMLRLDGLPHPRPIFDALKNRVIAVKRQRGVIKMDIG